MKQIIILILSIILTANTLYAADTEITLFDEAQNIWVNFELAEQKLIKPLDINVYQLLINIPDADSLYRQLSRIAFLKKLKDRTIKEYWSNPYIWSDPIESTAEYEKLKNTDTKFREIALKYESSKAERMQYLKKTNVFSKKNALREKHCKAFLDIEEKTHESLMALQVRMDLVRKNNHPTNKDRSCEERTTILSGG